MNYLFHLSCIIILLSSCSAKADSLEKNDQNEHSEYKLVEMDAYDFRRAYHGHDTLSEAESTILINRNPEPSNDYSNSSKHPLYNQLSKKGFFKDGNLNISAIDTLPDEFQYQVAPNTIFNVRTRYLENPEEVKTPSIELTFLDKNMAVLVDTLPFGWPPDIAFTKFDVNNDGTEELISIFNWYIVNGDNYDVKIYELKKSE